MNDIRTGLDWLNRSIPNWDYISDVSSSSDSE